MSSHGKQSRKMLHMRDSVTRGRSCGRKRKYSRDRARHIAESLSAMSGEFLVAYECRFCPSWHVGHSNTDPTASSLHDAAMAACDEKNLPRAAVLEAQALATAIAHKASARTRCIMAEGLIAIVTQIRDTARDEAAGGEG